eukprot:2305893-Rhodomonas_salina.1
MSSTDLASSLPTATAAVGAPCAGTNLLDSATGALSDGVEDYEHNVECGWLISPPDATTVTLTFSAFQTE